MKVIIATDGSDFSRAAIKSFCALVAEPQIEKVKVLSIYEELAPLATEPFGVSREYYQDAEASMRKKAEIYTADAVSQIRESFPNAEFNVEAETLMGSPGKSIVEIAENWGADLIVVGSHGRGFWNRMLLGSVSDAVVHHAPCSVMVIRDRQVE